MDYINAILANDAFWNFISVISSFVIVKITLTAERKNNTLNLEMQEKQLKVGLDAEERLHKESLKIEKEQVRANLLPFLKLEQKIDIGQRDGNYTFPLTITNCGNSGAFDIKVEHKALKNTGLCYVHKYELYDEIDYYQYTGYLYDNVLQVGNSGDFEILLDRFRNGKHYQKDDEDTVGEIHFTIYYKDSLYNQYRQQYMIQFRTGVGCGRVESYLPELIKESCDIETAM